MELELTRTTRTNRSTIGELTVDGKFECFVLGDKDRGLQQGMPLSELMATKIKTRTAIPKGRYEIVTNFSDRSGCNTVLFDKIKAAMQSEKVFITVR